MENSFPLQWPVGVPRAPRRQYSAFAERSISQATQHLIEQLRLLRATNVILSCNLALRKTDGMPKSDQRALDNDPGIAVYFSLKGRRICMPCDKWNKAADNIYAIAKHIEAMRGQERWGVGSLEQAFAGYAALPAPTKQRPWREVFGITSAGVTLMSVNELYRDLARLKHPDTGGSHEAMAELNQAYEEAKKELGI